MGATGFGAVLPEGRVRVPSGEGLMPQRLPLGPALHRHVRSVCIGPGDQFDADKMQESPPGSATELPANTSHFHWGKFGADVTKVAPTGAPSRLSFRYERESTAQTWGKR